MTQVSSHHDWRFGHIAAVGNGVRFTCLDCKAERTWSGRQLVERFTPDGTLGVVGPRLRCPQCGSAQVSAFVIGMGGGWHPGSPGDEAPTMAEKAACENAKSAAAPSGDRGA